MDIALPTSGMLPALLSPELAPLFWRPARLGYDSAWTTHVPFAHWLVAAARPRLLVELGTHHGVSYAGFCEAVVQCRLATRCFAVDTWQGDAHAGAYDESVYNDLRRFHDQHYAAFSELLRCTFDDALHYMADGSIDLLHIDGCHGYDEVRHDFENWLPKLSDRAVVLFHDTNVRERDFGVWRLFEDLGRRYPCFEFLHEFGLGVVAVGAEAPEAVRALCALRDPAAIGDVRERFSQLGERWRFEVHIRLLVEQVEQARRQLQSESQILQQRLLEASRIGARAAQRAGEARRAASGAFADVDRLTAELTAVRAELNAARAELAEQRHALAAAQAEVERLTGQWQSEVAALTAARQAEAERLSQDWQADVERLTAERHNDVARLLADWRAETERMTAALQAAQDAATAATQRAETEISRLTEALRAAQAEAEPGRAAIREAARLRQEAPPLAAAAAQARDLAARLRQELARTVGERDDWADAHDRLSRRFVTLEDDHDRLLYDRDRIAAEHAELRARFEDLTRKLEVWRRLPPRQAARPRGKLRRGLALGARIVWWTVSLRLRKGLRARAKLRRDLEALAGTYLFDARWYLDTYPDVAASGQDPALHYLRHGAAERRHPGPLFDADRYVADYPDVAAAGVNPLIHFLHHGAAEGRRIMPVGKPPVASEPYVLPAPRPAPPPPQLRPVAEIVEAAPADAPPLLPLAPAARRVVFFAGEPGTPGEQYRVARAAAAARRHGAAVECYPVAEAPMRRDAILAADTVVIWRAAWCGEVVCIIEAAHLCGAKLVFDVDDLMVEPELATIDLIDGIRTQFIPEAAVRGHYGRVRDTMANCDFCVVTTDELAWYTRVHAKPTFVLPNGFDAETLRASRHAARQRRRAAGDGLLRLGYAAGSRTHQRDFAVAAGAVARILREYPHARLVLFASPVDSLPVLDIAEFPAFNDLADRIEWRTMVALDALPAEIARFDINLAPLETGNPFCEAKSELKYFEAALVDVVTVASPTGPFRRAIDPGRTGLLAEGPEQWYRALRGLIDDPAAARRMARGAYRDALWRFGPERRAEAMAAILDQVQGGPAAARAFALETARAARPRQEAKVPRTEVVYESDRLGDAEVTVIVPLYNYEQHIVEALDSVAAQTLTDLHLVVIDDCSTDRSLVAAVSWAKRHAGRFGRVAVLRNLANMGLGTTRNAGFDAAETRYVLPLDADNRLRPACAELLLAEAERSGAAFVYPLTQEFGEAHGLLGSLPYAPQRLVGVPYIDAMALVSVAAWAAVGGYWEGRLGWEDYEFWCRLAEYGLDGRQVAGEVLADYRVHRGSMLLSITEARQNKPLVMAEMTRRHPWLSLVDAKRHAAPAPVAGAAVGALEALLPLLRCPLTGQALRLDAAAGMLVSEDGAYRWPVADGRPVLIPGLTAPPLLPAAPAALPEAARALIRAAGGPVLVLEAAGMPDDLPNAIAAGAALYPDTQVVADAHRLPFADGALAGVVALGGLEQYRDPRAVAGEMLRVLRPGGRVLARCAFLQPGTDGFYRAGAEGVAAWFAGFETEAVQVAGADSAARTLAAVAHAARSALAQDASPAAAAEFAATPMGHFARLWTDAAARDADAVWHELQALPSDAQAPIAAGFDYLGRRPLA